MIPADEPEDAEEEAGNHQYADTVGARPLLARPRAVAVIPIPVSNIDGAIVVVAGM